MRRRRTARWRRAKVRRGHLPARARVAVVGALLLCTTAALPGGSALAAGTPSPYAFAPDARSVTGAAGTSDAAPLTPGATYRSSLPSDGRTYYSLELDAVSDVYVSATAIPAPGSTVRAGDGIKVSVEDSDGRSCSSGTKTFGIVSTPRPIAAWGAREISVKRSRCETAGTYYVIVERVSTATSTPGTWDLELFATSEPPLRQTGATTAPEAWDSASQAPLTGEATRREGGSGFAAAESIGTGVWSSDIEPGRTLFYKVPLDWGRQLYATAELGSSNSGAGNAGGALNLSLYNPVHGFVDDASATYDGRQKTAELDPLPPVTYENRYAGPAPLSAMRFAGSYYLVVHLAAGVAEKFGEGPFRLTLRVRLEGAAQSGPAYAGAPEPRGVIEAGTGDWGAAAGGGAGSGAGGGGDAAMTVLAVSGIGTGTVVLVVLGVWTVVARRRAGAV
ncbi:membrane protein [Streptomyces viridochromogenes]|nr:membrane protein [Streptomyces viridochromogenes]